MNSLLLISPYKGSGFNPILSGNWELVILSLSSLALLYSPLIHSHSRI
ncbi:hypothetical protein QUB68_11805 [Microcoleus sp. A006_D1]